MRLRECNSGVVAGEERGDKRRPLLADMIAAAIVVTTSGLNAPTTTLNAAP